MSPGRNDSPHPDRRRFLTTSGRAMGAGWLAMHLPMASVLAACSREAAQRGEPLTTLTPREGRTLDALAEAILPSGELPGARDAGAVHFVDLAVERLFPEFLDVVRQGLAELNERAGAGGTPPGDDADDPEARSGFAALDPPRRDAVIREMEDTPFFQVARMLVVMGTFSDPVHGGNREQTGWELLGMQHAPAYDPPFGHYDAEYGSDDQNASGREG